MLAPGNFVQTLMALGAITAQPALGNEESTAMKTEDLAGTGLNSSGAWQKFRIIDTCGHTTTGIIE